MCGLYTSTINLKPYFLYSQHDIQSLSFFFGILFVAHAIISTATAIVVVIVVVIAIVVVIVAVIAIVVVVVIGVPVLTGDHMVLIAPARRPQCRQNRRHRSSDAPSCVIRSHTSFYFVLTRGDLLPFHHRTWRCVIHRLQQRSLMPESPRPTLSRSSLINPIRPLWYFRVFLSLPSMRLLLPLPILKFLLVCLTCPSTLTMLMCTYPLTS